MMAWLAALFGSLALFFRVQIGDLAKRALVAVGIGTITYTGLDYAFASARDAVVANYGAMAGATADIANLAGVGASIGIILGAMASRVALMALSQLGKLL